MRRVGMTGTIAADSAVEEDREDECDKGSCPASKAFFLVAVLITTVWK